MHSEAMIFLQKNALVAFLILWSTISLVGQQESDIGKQVEIILLDDNKILGEVISIDDSVVIIKTGTLGDLTIRKSEIKLWNATSSKIIVGLDPEVQDYYNATTYLVNPSGYTLKKGQAYYQNIGVFFNSYSVGISDRFSLTGGVELISPLFASRFPSLFISPRYGIPFGNEKGAFSVGATGLIIVNDDNPLVVGIAQAAVTIGSRNNNITIGSGLGFTFEEGFEGSTIPFNLSGMTRISRRLSLVTDNFIIAYDDFNRSTGILSLGVRLHFQNQAAFNFGLWRSLEDWDSDILALPFISLTLPIK